jgi:hypothetical protein
VSGGLLRLGGDRGSSRLPTWLLFVSFAIAGFLIGRVVPFTGRVESVTALLAGSLVAGTVAMRRGNAVKMPSSYTAAFVFCSCLTYWLGMLFGSEVKAQRTMGAISIIDVLLYVLGALVLLYVLLHGRKQKNDATPRSVISGDPQPNWRQRWEETRKRPWNVAGWLVVVLLVLLVFIPCLIVIPLALWIPAYQARQATSEMGSLTIDFDPLTPITQIKVVSGPSNVHNVFPVASRPFFMRFPTGEYTLELTYVHDGERFTLAEPFVIARGGDHHMNLALAIDDDLSERLRNKAKVQLQNNGAPPLVREAPDDPGEPQ